MKAPGYRGRAVGSVALAWLVFIGIDFLFHGSILRFVWNDSGPAILDRWTLFRRIPFGYASFLVLVILIFLLLTRIHGRHPEPRKGLLFGLSFAGLFSLSYFLGLFSFVAIPAQHLLPLSLVYFLELSAVSWLLAFLLNSMSTLRVLGTVGAFFLLITLGVVVQNLWH